LRIGFKAQKRDIISDYANFGSKTYAPIKREGLRADRDADKFEANLLQAMTRARAHTHTHTHT
jgi:hypothetical protein